MNKIWIILILIISSLVCLNIPNIHSQEQSGLFWMENPYYAITSAYDTTGHYYPIFIENKLIDIRETVKFQTLKEYAEVNFKKPYLTIINRISRRGTVQGSLNNQDTIIYCEYVFIEVDTIDLWEGHPRVKYLYYDKNDSICIKNNSETAISMRIMRNEKLNIKLSFQKPRFMFDAAIIKINEDSEDIVENLLSFWRFKPECKYYDIDYVLYDGDSYFLFDWMREFAYSGIFTKKFGFTDFDF